MKSISPHDLAHCRQRLAEEEAWANRASSHEAREAHDQLAALYRIQLELLKTSRF